MNLKERILKFIVIIVKICIILLLITLLNRLFMPKYVDENQDGNITEEYYDEKLDTDVIFAGSSTVYSGISPVELFRETGISSYTRSNASQTIWISYYMIEDAISYNRPKLVMVDVAALKYEDDYAEEPSTRKSLDGMRFSLSKIKCIRESMGPDEKMADYIFPVFRFHTRWKELGYDDLKYAIHKPKVTNNGHIIDNITSLDKDLEILNGYGQRGIDRLTEHNLSYIEKIIRLCKENDVDVMFMKMPSNYCNWSDDYDVQILEICDGYGVKYDNFDYKTKDIGLDFARHSPDGGQHLNTEGAELFTKYLGKYIIDNYSLKGHADDERYRSVWEKKAEFYESEKARF